MNRIFCWNVAEPEGRWTMENEMGAGKRKRDKKF